MPTETVVVISLVIAAFVLFMITLAGTMIYTQLGEKPAPRPARATAPDVRPSAQPDERHAA